MRTTSWAGAIALDLDPTLWELPSEVRALLLDHDREAGVTTLSWDGPASPGGPRRCGTTRSAPTQVTDMRLVGRRR